VAAGRGGEAVKAAELEPGDVPCYLDHVAFWLGDGWIMHASSREGGSR
jgi:cell wall-associated NlpC family hydrolase